MNARGTRRMALRVLAALAAIPLLYLLAALVGALVPRNAGWSEPDSGVLVFVRSNGAHADLVLPVRAAGLDWHLLAPPGHAAEADAAAGWIAIGWGQREFYLETERWADLTVRTAARALTGGDPLMHVAHLPEPRPSPRMRPLRLTPDAYRRLARHMAAAFARGEGGAPIPLPGTGYAGNDVFYEARGTYHAFRTSNQWTGDMLGAAGARIGVWTPFAQGIMWRFRDEPDERDGTAMR